jgi:hypothetical protein
LFIHAILMDGHLAMCTSAPVIYAAVGRRLGYPIKLVKTKCHVFCRWDDPHGERFNIEATSPGFYTHSDEYYRRWPYPWTQSEKRMGYWLHSLSPRQELAMFLDWRGTCWLDNFQTENASAAFAASCRLSNCDPDIESRWAIATFLHPMIVQMRKLDDADSVSPMLGVPMPQERWQAGLAQAAHEWLNRVLCNRRDKTAAAIQQRVNSEIVSAC